MPLFESYVDLYASDPGLRFSLRDLYEDYLDFCIDSIKWMSHSAAGKTPYLFWISLLTH